MKEMMETALRTAADEVRIGKMCTPFFVVDAPGETIIVSVPLPDDPAERHARMTLIRKFMVSKKAWRFVIGGVMSEPDCVYACGVERHRVMTAIRRITSAPLAFGSVEWWTRNNVGEKVFWLLPKRFERLRKRDRLIVEQLFGRGGMFEPQVAGTAKPYAERYIRALRYFEHTRISGSVV